MICDEIKSALAAFSTCTITDWGACITTHCLYPSFEPVKIYVVKFGDGYRVHDACQTMRVAFQHGRDSSSGLTRFINRECERRGIEWQDGALQVTVPAVAWLGSAIVTVANAAATVASHAVERVVQAAEAVLKERIESVLSTSLHAVEIHKDFVVHGVSGKTHVFDFAVKHRDRSALINAVSPHPVSVSAKYVSFADTKSDEHHTIRKIGVFERELDNDDIALLTQVAELVPFKALNSKPAAIVGV